MSNFKSGFVSIIGRTNVGKSTLINSLAHEKIAITANKSQTTRTAIRAIINRENSQIIFIDTPGVHKPKTKLGNTMLETVWQTVPNSDVTLFVIDATQNKIGTGDRIILDKIKELKEKTILVINKIDLVEKEKLLKIIEMYKNEYNFEAIIPVSSLENENTEVILEEMLQIFIKEHTLSKKAHEEMIALSHQDEEIAKIFHDKELETTKKIVETLKEFGINSPNLLEKVHIIIGIVENYCHEVVYHKHSCMNYDIMKQEVIKMITTLLK